MKPRQNCTIQAGMMSADQSLKYVATSRTVGFVLVDFLAFSNLSLIRICKTAKFTLLLQSMAEALEWSAKHNQMNICQPIMESPGSRIGDFMVLPVPEPVNNEFTLLDPDPSFTAFTLPAMADVAIPLPIHNQASAEPAYSSKLNHKSNQDGAEFSHTIPTINQIIQESSHSAKLGQSGTEPIRCWLHGCQGRSFSLLGNYRRHCKEKGAMRRKAICPRCGKQFSRLAAQRTHYNELRCKIVMMDANGIPFQQSLLAAPLL